VPLHHNIVIVILHIGYTIVKKPEGLFGSIRSLVMAKSEN